MRQGIGDRYLVEKVNTATPAQLTGMLFDAAIRLMRAGLAAADRRDRPEVNRRLLKAQEIVMELRLSLDFEAGGQLARQLEATYVYLHAHLMRANVAMNPALINECISILEPIQLAWREACLRPAAATA